MSNKEICLRINGAQVENADGAFLISPGRRNTLTLEVSERYQGNYCIVLEVIAPDGRRRREEADVSPGGAAKLDLGPFTVPSIYEYEAGVVYRRGYRLVVSVVVAGKSETPPAARFELYQGCSRDENADSLYLGSMERVEYNDGWIPEGGKWVPHAYSGRPMDPPIDFRLGPQVLVDQDAVTVWYRLRHKSPELSPIAGIVSTRDRSGKELVKPETVLVEEGWKSVEVGVARWNSGSYLFELRPEIEGKVYEEGPVLEYRRIDRDPDDILVSPLAPFTLKRDHGRPELRIDDWRLSQLPDGLLVGSVEKKPAPGWKSVDNNGKSALHCSTDGPRSSLILNPRLSGTYAVFIKPAGRVYIDAGDGLLRPVGTRPRDACFASIPVFAFAGDITDKKVEIKPRGTAISGVEQLLLVPVTEDSVDVFTDAVRHPPVPLRGISDWACYFMDDGMTYLEDDQFDMIIAGQRETGISSLNWAIGRSWVNYHTRLARAMLFPTKEFPEKPLSDYPFGEAIRRMHNDFDALGSPLEKRSKHDMRISNWLCMNRHYSPSSRGGTHTSPWVMSHPELNMRLKNSDDADVSRVEFYFEEARSERIDIFVESAGFDTDGVVIGWCRQPPHAGYHPEMVEEYKGLTGDNPLKMDYSDGQKYVDWLKWRCERGTTQLMRDLRKVLGGRVPIIARVPTGGFLFDMAMGMDTETWIKERLIDELQLDPQENRCEGFGSHDVRPYLDLCRKYGIPVFGGVNGTTGTRPIGQLEADENAPGPNYSPAVALKRAIALIETGVDGIEIYESEQFAHMNQARWLVPLWGNRELALKFLNESNLEAVYPIAATNATCGHDNHWTAGHSVYGKDQLPRGATRLL